MIYDPSAGKHYYYLTILCSLLIGYLVGLFQVGAINNLSLNKPTQEPLTTSALVSPKTTSSDHLEKTKSPLTPIATPPIKDTSNAKMTSGELLQFVENAPAISIGDGPNEIYVLFDPGCSYCHTFYMDLINGLADKKGLNVNWIPSLLFTENQGSLIFGLYLTEMAISDPIAAKKTLNDVIANDNVELPDNWKPQPNTVSLFTEATQFMYAALRDGGGTPVVVWKNKLGGVEVFAGIPVDSDWNSLRRNDQ